MRSPYRGKPRIPTASAPSLPGAPRERRVAPITRMRRPDTLRDDVRPVAVNSDQRVRATVRTRPDASGTGRYVVEPLPAMPLVYGPAYKGVTSRKALKRAPWSSRMAGGHTV